MKRALTIFEKVYGIVKANANSLKTLVNMLILDSEKTVINT